MANIILYTDFDTVGKISLPETLPTDPVGSLLATFITDNEATYLTEILSYAMAKVAIPAMAVPPVAPSIWYDLLYGKEFTDKHGRLNKWPGFRNNVQKLAIANYIYVKWLEDRQDYSTGVGHKKAKSENAVDVSPIRKICKAWNEMVDLNYILDDFLTQNVASYPDYEGIYGWHNGYQWHSGCFIRTSDKSTYGNARFFIKRNIYGL